MSGFSPSAVPRLWRWEQVALPLSYTLKPGHEQERVTLKVPAALFATDPAKRLGLAGTG